MKKKEALHLPIPLLTVSIYVKVASTQYNWVAFYDIWQFNTMSFDLGKASSKLIKHW